MRTLISTFLLLCLFALADVRECHFIHTTDTHTQFQPRYEGNGGWLMAATIIKQLQERVGTENSLLIDTGDTVQGSVAASLSKGMAGLVPLHYLKYDAWIPGNHEFDYGIDQFLFFMKEEAPIALCANLAVKGHPNFTPWRMFTRNGMRIAVIGLTSSFMKNWQLPGDAERLAVTPGVLTVKRILPAVLSAKPDVIILATHQGWFIAEDKRGVNELNAIAMQFPEIDIILGAHSHRVFPGRIIGKRTWYVQPGDHGEYVAHITVTVDTDTHKVLDVSSVLCPVEPGTPLDMGLKRLLNPHVSREIAERKRPIAGSLKTPALARGTCGISCATSELIGMAMAEQANAVIAFSGKYTNKDIPAGALAADILYKLIPYDNTIVTAQLTLAEIKAIIEEQWRWRKNYSYCAPSGIRVTMSQKGECTIDGLGKSGGLPPDAHTRRFTVAFHNHAAAGSGRFLTLREILSRPAANMKATGIPLQKALENFLAAHPGITVTPFQWLRE